MTLTKYKMMANATSTSTSAADLADMLLHTRKHSGAKAAVLMGLITARLIQMGQTETFNLMIEELALAGGLTL